MTRGVTPVVEEGKSSYMGWLTTGPTCLIKCTPRLLHRLLSRIGVAAQHLRQEEHFLEGGAPVR